MSTERMQEEARAFQALTQARNEGALSAAKLAEDFSNAVAAGQWGTVSAFGRFCRLRGQDIEDPQDRAMYADIVQRANAYAAEHGFTF